MTQDSLNFGRLYLAAGAANRLYRILGDAVDSAGGKTVAAAACKIDRSDMDRGLKRDGRRIAVDHAQIVALMSSQDTAKKICNAFCEPMGFRVVPAPTKLSDKRRAEVMESVMHTLGPIAVAAMEAALAAALDREGDPR